MTARTTRAGPPPPTRLRSALAEPEQPAAPGPIDAFEAMLGHRAMRRWLADEGSRRCGSR